MATIVTAAQFDPTKHQKIFQPNEGPQERVFLCTETEICYGGSKGGGKSYAAAAWLVWGNQAWGDPIIDPITGKRNPVHESYIHHPRYRALVLRKNAIDMRTWIAKASTIYVKLGAKLIYGSPTRFRFPSGAEIVISHLADKMAWEKYAGQECHRMVIEELTQIPDEETYLLAVTSCLRSVDDDLRPQVLSTCNPGGPGHGWVKRRFVKPHDALGNPIEEGTTIVDPDSEMERVFIRARLIDNPYLMKSGKYQRLLKLLPPKLRRAMLYGDWDVLEGQFFSEFRADGPLDGEPEWARHVVDPVPIPRFSRRWIGGDWGYTHNSPFYWFAKCKDTRVHTYREMIKQRTGSYRLGIEVAERTLPDLANCHIKSMALYIGGDLWSQRDDGPSPAIQMQEGIKRVLGDRGCVLRAAAKEAKKGNMELVQDLLTSGGADKGRIIITPAYRDRVAGAACLHELLRWEPAIKIDQNDYDPKFGKELNRKDPRGTEFLDYYASFFEEEPEVLPKVVIHGRNCKRLVERIPEMVHDPGRPEDMLKREGDDEVDAWRYGLYSQNRIEAEIPEDIYVRQEMEVMMSEVPMDPSDWQFVNATLKRRYNQLHKSGMKRVKIPRRGPANTSILVA